MWDQITEHIPDHSEERVEQNKLCVGNILTSMRFEVVNYGKRYQVFVPAKADGKRTGHAEVSPSGFLSYLRTAFRAFITLG